MSLDLFAKTEFIEGVVLDLTKNIKDPSPETMDGMRDYATNLYNRIGTLIRRVSIIDQTTGEKLPHRVE